MIGSVERLPVEWEARWKEIKTGSGRDLAIKEGKQFDLE
jgi:hypothetical protein